MVKRIIATLIDILLYFIVLLGIEFWFQQSNILLNDDLIRVCLYFILFLIPIYFYKTTCGYFIFKLYANDRGKLFLKYLFYYALYSGSFFLVLALPTINYGYLNQFHVSLDILSLLFSICITNILIFCFSIGKYNLFDFILNLRYNNFPTKRHEYLIFSFWLLLFFNFLIPLIILNQKDVIPEMYSRINQIKFQPSYFPPDIFDSYSNEQFVIDQQNVNDGFLLLNKNSFFKKTYYNQRIIKIEINANTFKSINKRFDLCKEILLYDIYSLDLRKNDKVDQLKLDLIYVKPVTTFFTVTYTFHYYYETNAKYTSLTGGINDDSLINQYKSALRNYSIYFNYNLSRILKKPIDSLNHNPTFTLDQNQSDSFMNVLNKYVVKEVHPKIISFSEVKPEKLVSLNFILGNAGPLYKWDFWKNDIEFKHDSAINYRNLLDYNLSNPFQ